MKVKDKIKVIARINSNHGYQIGDTCIITRIANVKTGQIGVSRLSDGFNQTLNRGEYELYGNSIKDLEKELEVAQETVAEIEEKLEYMKGQKLSVFDESTYRIWKILKTLPKNMNNLEKAKTIKNIVSP